MAPSGENLRDIAEQAEVENKAPGAEVRYGDDLSTNASYNKSIPPDKGGEVDAHGRQIRGIHFDPTGQSNSSLNQGAEESSVPFSQTGGDVMPEGKEAPTQI
ncbi:hypothetical protein BJ170DRAFT_732238 [Xylariales sp. AK1849]|nr:hypothetical protein BJ170DRAFT_732238 [Xylariales sp. AK1849]